MTHGWLLVPSPVLGPASWGPVAAVMDELGQSVTIARTTMTSAADLDHVTPWVNEILALDPPSAGTQTVVVGHSAACPRMPYLVSQLIGKGWDVRAMILVDGRFPTGEAFTSLESYGEMLDGMVRPDDYLPPWPRWWGSLVSGLVVDPVARDLVFNEAPPVPRTWFDQSCPVPELPATVGRGFLSFGPGYAQACDQAYEEGWLTTRLSGDHLHQVVAPAPVAATLMAMVAGMSCGRGYPYDNDLDR
ncbi:MAG: hypothetical protein AAF531_20390 [Actinomycetota bacterium]